MKKSATLRRIRVLGQWRLLHDRENDDLTLALALLCGFYEHVGDAAPRLKFLDSKDQRTKDQHQEARRALARLLRSEEPLDRNLREALATLIDPSAGRQVPLSEQLISIGRRGRERVGEGVRNRFLALAVHTKRKEVGTVELAVAAVADREGLSEDAVRKVWAKNRKSVVALLSNNPKRRVI